jgi:ABC-2 type transport system ATP-binding protein
MTAAIEVAALAKRFGDVRALDGVDLRVEPGEFFGLLGPNGAGKTTLISILAGLARPDSGSARVMGHDVIRDYRQSRRALGVVPQELVFDPFFTVRETLRIQSGYFGLRRNDAWIDEIIDALDLTDRANTNMRTLSGGMKRRVLVAQALVHKPPVIILDEPTAGVDVQLRQGLWTFIRRLNGDGHTVVLTTHYLEEAEAMCGRIALLKAGRLVALDSTANLIKTFHDHVYLRVTLAGANVPTALLERVHAREGARYTFRIADYAAVEPILAALAAAGCHVSELELEKPDLEEVFIGIMRGAERDPSSKPAASALA